MIGALCAAAAVLLLWSGVVKLARPAATARMVAGVLGRQPQGSHTAARLIGLVEVAVGAAVLVTGGRVACAALAACYLVFTAVAVRLAGAARPAPCGCFGRADAPTGRIHVVVDAVACAAAIAGTVASPGPWGGYTGQPALVTVVGLGQVLLLAAMAYLLVAVLPSVLSDRDQVVGRS
jgi:Methylamine utilisation protein MauE